MASKGSSHLEATLKTVKSGRLYNIVFAWHIQAWPCKSYYIRYPRSWETLQGKKGGEDRAGLALGAPAGCQADGHPSCFYP